MTFQTPQIIVSLSPTGKLKIELPGTMNTRRSLELLPGKTEETLLRILQAQQAGQTEIGLDGAPTQAQVRYWERHASWPDQSCRFCQAEGKAKADQGAGLRAKKKILFTRGEVQARIIPAKAKGAQVSQKVKVNAEELGL